MNFKYREYRPGKFQVYFSYQGKQVFIQTRGGKPLTSQYDAEQLVAESLGGEPPEWACESCPRRLNAVSALSKRRPMRNVVRCSRYCGIHKDFGLNCHMETPILIPWRRRGCPGNEGK